MNWQNITVEAPSRGNGMSLPGGIQRQPEEPGAVSGEPVSEDDKRKIALIKKESGCTKKLAEERNKKFNERISELKPEIEKKFDRLSWYLRVYLKLPKEINKLDLGQSSKKEQIGKKITQIIAEFNILANEGIENVRSLSLLLEIIGRDDYMQYQRLNGAFQSKQLAYKSQQQKQDTKNKPQSQEPEPLETPVNETQKSNNPMDILKTYGYHWDVARDVLAYGDEESMNQMMTLVKFRSTVVSKVLQDTMEKVGKNIGGTDGAFNENSQGATLSINVPIGEQPEETKQKILIKAIAPGSSNLTSDYDVTFQIEQLPEHEADLVREFNQKFRNYFVSLGGPAYESGVVFDTNVYTSGILGKKGSLYKPKTTEGNEELARQQLAFSLVAILKGLPQQQWDNFKNQVIKETKKALPLNSNGVKIINEVFEEAKSHIRTTSEAVDKLIRS